MATHSSILAGKFHGQRRLVSYSPWGCKKSDMTEYTHKHKYTHAYTHTQRELNHFVLYLKLRQHCKSTMLLLLFSHQVVSNSLWPHGLQHTRLPCPSPSPRVCPSSCPLNRWCHPTISSSVALFSCLQSFPSSGSFPMNQLFTSGGQSIGASASVLANIIQGWSPLRLTVLISLQTKGLSRVSSSATVRKASILWCSAFFIVQLSQLYFN